MGGYVGGWVEPLFCPSSVASVGGAELFAVCPPSTKMMLTRGSAVSVVSVVSVVPGGLVEAPPPSHNVRLSMIRCLRSAFFPVHFRPFAYSATFMSDTFALFLSPVPYNVNWMHKDELLVSGPGGLGPLMALQITV